MTVIVPLTRRPSGPVGEGHCQGGPVASCARPVHVGEGAFPQMQEQCPVLPTLFGSYCD